MSGDIDMSELLYANVTVLISLLYTEHCLIIHTHNIGLGFKQYNL